jgi:hypothetical protein
MYSNYLVWEKGNDFGPGPGLKRLQKTFVRTSETSKRNVGTLEKLYQALLLSDYCIVSSNIYKLLVCCIDTDLHQIS